MTQSPVIEARHREEGFTLLEVLVAFAVIAFAAITFNVIVGGAMNRAVVTKVNRQLRQLVEFQMGQVTVGKLHPDEDDPFPDGQSGAFEDVGGYPEEYEAFTWTLRREEIPICGTNEDDLEKAGFRKEPGATEFTRAQTDDILAGKDEHLEKPAGQFKSRVTLTVKWNGRTEDEDQGFSIVTLLPVNGEEEGGGSGPGGPGDPNAPGPAPAGGANAGKETLDRSGAVKKG
jgi:type II secretory pathway pseudopilin PulG